MKGRALCGPSLPRGCWGSRACPGAAVGVGRWYLAPTAGPLQTTRCAFCGPEAALQPWIPPCTGSGVSRAPGHREGIYACVFKGTCASPHQVFVWLIQYYSGVPTCDLLRGTSPHPLRQTAPSCISSSLAFSQAERKDNEGKERPGDIQNQGRKGKW